MAFKNSNDFIETLEKQGELVRVKTKVSTDLEISEIADRMVKSSGKAILFENTGTKFPVLINSMASEKRINIALGVEDIDDHGDRIKALFEMATSPMDGLMNKLKMIPKLGEVSNWMPTKLKKKGECQEFEIPGADISQIPVLKTWPHDGGPFITLPVVHTISAEKKIHNMGMYRMQVYDKNTTGMHWHLHKGGASHYREYQNLGKKMPVTVTIGGDPAYIYAATAPLPENIDEYLLAGFLRRKKVRLVKCLTNDIWVPEDVDFVIEGYVDTSEDLRVEGPFGDHTGYYSLADLYPVFHITKITHRANPVYPATIVGIPPQEDAWIGLATERIFLNPIKMTMVPEIIDMHMPPEGVFHNIVLASIKATYPGQALKVMSSLWGAGQMMFNKFLLITDENQKIFKYDEIARVISDNVDPVDDVIFNRGPMDVLDHASQKYAFGGKMGIDATSNKPKNWLVEMDYQSIEKITNVIEVHLGLLKKNIKVLLLKISKTQAHEERLIAKKIIEGNFAKGVKFIVFMEEKAVLSDYADVVWRAANNIDPTRDCFYIQNENGTLAKTLFMDATRKYKEFDGFERDWPNIVTMDEITMDKVDKRWPEYGLGDLIESPSRKYIKQLYEGGAVAE